MWTRTYLRKYGLTDNCSRGVRALTPEGRRVDPVNPREVKQLVQKQSPEARDETGEGDLDEQESWRDDLLDALLETEPSAFERIAQRLLRETGFIKVEVTGRSGGGGVDGRGVVRLGGLLSFHVILQCKRYRGSVSVSQVQDFRAAMVGRADKDLLIRTEDFTRDAMREAVRDGAPAIDLIDGGSLVEKLKELGLGVRTEGVQTEQVSVDRHWFGSM